MHCCDTWYCTAWLAIFSVHQASLWVPPELFGRILYNIVQPFNSIVPSFTSMRIVSDDVEIHYGKRNAGTNCCLRAKKKLPNILQMSIKMTAMYLRNASPLMVCHLYLYFTLWCKYSLQLLLSDLVSIFWQVLKVKDKQVHPQWNGTVENGFDIGILEVDRMIDSLEVPPITNTTAPNAFVNQPVHFFHYTPTLEICQFKIVDNGLCPNVPNLGENTFCAVSQSAQRDPGKW